MRTFFKAFDYSSAELLRDSLMTNCQLTTPINVLNLKDEFLEDVHLPPSSLAPALGSAPGIQHEAPKQVRLTGLRGWHVHMYVLQFYACSAVSVTTR